MALPAISPRFAAFIAGSDGRWPQLGMSVDEVRDFCDEEELWPLVHSRLSGPLPHDWPDTVAQDAASRSRDAAAIELLRGREIARVLAALADRNVRVLVTKGTALAYSLYAAPSLRQRDDTDLLIPASQVSDARRVMVSLGYVPTPLCSEVLWQFEMQRRDAAGIVHAFDLHWQISAHAVFAKVVLFDEALPRSVPLPALGPGTLTLAHDDALLLACIHPAMHHRNRTRALWMYDIHLLAGALGPGGLTRFAARARDARVAAVCAHSMRLATTLFGTQLVPGLLETLARAPAEPSAAYLDPGRRWHRDVFAGMKAASGLPDRARLLKAILFPSPEFMLARAENHGKRPPRWHLSVLYARRQMHGAWKVLAGKK